MRVVLGLFLFCLASCTSTVKREEVIARAVRYADVCWLPRAEHVHHGPDSKGIAVHTPDRSAGWDGAKRGWWQPGKPARGMPYQWGGFDTPESFLKKLEAGYRAGDAGNEAKRKLGDSGVSTESCGIDCSGFVSRCWGLPRPYSTRELPTLCDPLASWDALKAGDILLNDRHVVLFNRWLVPGEEIGAYEAGPFPVWRVNACGLQKRFLIENGYKPWRYKRIGD
ncbi:MAG: hypothetical protein V4733_05060 [Verrucomicrobiota bacterium]